MARGDDDLPDVLLHASALDMIADWGEDEGGQTGILVGPADAPAGQVEVLDASPLSEIASSDSWTSEAVAEAVEYTKKWHVGKKIGAGK